MASFTKVVFTIYLIILIIFMLIIILPIIYAYFFNPRGDPDVEHPTDTKPEGNNQIEEIEPDNLITNDAVMAGNYQRWDLNVNLADLSENRPANQTKSVITYADFKKIALEPEFINTLTTALEVSFKDKKIIYQKKLKEIEVDLGRAGGGGGMGGLLNHDTRLQRLTKQREELYRILKSIEAREKTLTVKEVRTNLFQAIHHRTKGIESLIGRDHIKDFLALQIYSFSRNPKSFYSTFQNLAIYGPSGVGKTKVAETIAYVFACSGILVRQKIRNVTKHEFTSSYVNEAAGLTRELLNSTLEGVLFVDEAYDLTPANGLLGRMYDHGNEAITEMVNFLDKYTGLSIVIVAGYEDQMEERFMKANEGLPRRFPYKLRLTSYSSVQLTDILISFMKKSAPELNLTQADANCIYSLVDLISENRPTAFDKQAGDMNILSGDLNRAIYGAFGRKWIPGDEENNAELILDGFNQFLRNKKLELVDRPRKR